MGEPGGLPSMGSHRVGHDLSDLAAAARCCKDVHSWHLFLDHVQFTLIHRPNIPGSYATLFFTALDFISIIGHVHIWALFFFGSISSFFLELFLY